jgi:hypothetical protein
MMKCDPTKLGSILKGTDAPGRNGVKEIELEMQFLQLR